MPRKAREKSGTGIYHVMLRGINHQDIFEERSDYWKFLKLLRLQTHPKVNRPFGGIVDNLSYPQFLFN